MRHHVEHENRDGSSRETAFVLRGPGMDPEHMQASRADMERAKREHVETLYPGFVARNMELVESPATPADEAIGITIGYFIEKLTIELTNGETRELWYDLTEPMRNTHATCVAIEETRGKGEQPS